ncbi:MAG: transposase [Pseudomonadota bacterium]|nr:transposase [Pseudomonadota bacterium]
MRQEYPAIAREAKRQGATIYWGDEMGLRSDHVAGTSYAPLGQTPIVRATGQRLGCNMISAISNRGQLAFMVFRGTFVAPLFGSFMQRLLEQAKGKVYLIVDGHPVHRSRVAKKFVAANDDRLRLMDFCGRHARRNHCHHQQQQAGQLPDGALDPQAHATTEGFERHLASMPQIADFLKLKPATLDRGAAALSQQTALGAEKNPSIGFR